MKTNRLNKEILIAIVMGIIVFLMIGIAGHYDRQEQQSTEQITLELQHSEQQNQLHNIGE